MNFEMLIDNFGMLMAGAWTSIWMVVVSLIIGLAIALAAAVMSTSKNPFLRWPAEFFSFIFRGTPLLIQLYIFYYGFGVVVGSIEGIRETIWWPLIKMSWPWVIMAMSLNTAAYTCEIIRGAIQNTLTGEIEAARSMGMSRATMLRRIILPSALRRSLPAYGNEVIYMLHGSAVLSWFAVTDLMGVGRRLRDQYYDSTTALVGVAIIYLCITALIVVAFKHLEKRYLSYLKR